MAGPAPPGMTVEAAQYAQQSRNAPAARACLIIALMSMAVLSQVQIGVEFKHGLVKHVKCRLAHSVYPQYVRREKAYVPAQTLDCKLPLHRKWNINVL